MLSIIIPSYKDPLLQRTVDSLLEQAEGEIEIVIVLDGYWPTEYNWSDPRIKIVHLGETRGMREAINAGVKVSTGKYIMRTDEHCMFGPGYDRILTENIEDNWIVTPRRFFLDTEKWEVMDIPPIDYEKLCIDRSRMKFAGIPWTTRTEERKDILIDETMAMQGSCWVMPRAWWDKVIVELQTEGYGTHYQDSVEMTMKTWQAGGKLMINKKTWHAHRHRDFPRTHHYPNALANSSFEYSLKVWGDYYEKVIKPLWKI